MLPQDFYVRLEKENTSGEEYTLHERTRARGAGLGCGAGGRRTRPAPGRGAGMRAPPEVPQSRRGRKGRASGCPRPAAAVTAPARAPPSPRRQAAPPPPHGSGSPQPGPRIRSGSRSSPRGERGARNLLSACGGCPSGAPSPATAEATRRRRPALPPRPRPLHPAAIYAAAYLSPQAGVRLQRLRLRRLPPGRRIPAPSANHNTERAGGRPRGGVGPSCACAVRASL